MTWFVHPYDFRIDGEHKCKSGARAERVQKPDSGYVDLDYGGLAALLADLVGESVANIMGHALVKGLGDWTSDQSGTSMPIGYSMAVRDGDDRGGVDRALAKASWLGTYYDDKTVVREENKGSSPCFEGRGRRIRKEDDEVAHHGWRRTDRTATTSRVCWH